MPSQLRYIWTRSWRRTTDEILRRTPRVEHHEQILQPNNSQNWKRSFISTNIWLELDGQRSLTVSSWAKHKWRSGFKTDAWSRRKCCGKAYFQDWCWFLGVMRTRTKLTLVHLLMKDHFWSGKTVGRLPSERSRECVLTREWTIQIYYTPKMKYATKHKYVFVDTTV